MVFHDENSLRDFLPLPFALGSRTHLAQVKFVVSDAEGLPIEIERHCSGRLRVLNVSSV